jgi:uncharacterized protein
LELTINQTEARRLFISKQRLNDSSGSPPYRKDIVHLFRDLGCVQIDPISAVAPSHYLVLWSRLGNYDRSLLSEMYREKILFEYWAHQLSILLWEDYPLFLSGMRNYPDLQTVWGKRVLKWMKDNKKLETYILSELRKKGPLASREFEDKSERRWSSSGWSNNRNVSRMLQFLFFQGKVMVTERNGNTKLWDLAQRCLPENYSKEEVGDEEIEYQAVQRSLKALGVATPSHIRKHFMRDSYPNLLATLSRLESDSKIARVKVKGFSDGKKPWYIHNDDLALLERIQGGEWIPKTRLLSPFDNLICDRARTSELFDFDFKLEIYVPQKLRKYGYYVMPILYGDRVAARLDPVFQKASKELVVNRIFLESGFAMDIGSEIDGAVSDLASFVGATKVRYRKVPELFRNSIRSSG